MLQEICETHLAQLASNATAFHNEQRHFGMTIQGCRYQNLPVSRYRVYCLERLREEYGSLAEADRSTVRALLPWPEATLIWSPEVVAKSGYDEARQAPFNKAINVYGDGVPQ